MLSVLLQAPTDTTGVATTPVSKKSRLQPVVPTLKLAGDTKGDATFKAGIDLSFGARETQNYHTLAPQAEVNLKNGSGTLFSRDKDGAQSSGFSLGLTYSHHMTQGLGEFTEERQADDKALMAAVRVCAERCSGTPADGDKKFCDLYAKEAKAAVVAPPVVPPTNLRGTEDKLLAAEKAYALELAKALTNIRDVEGKALRDARASGSAEIDAATQQIRIQGATAERLRAEGGIFPDRPEFDPLRTARQDVEIFKEAVDAAKPGTDQAWWLSIARQKLCPTGLASLEREIHIEDRYRLGLPLRSLHAGVRGGPTALKYAGGELDDAGVEGAPFSDENQVRGSFTAALSGHWLFNRVSPRRAIGTLELFAGGGRAWPLGDDKLKWCMPAGDLEVDETAYAAEVCKETAFKRPTRNGFLSAGIYAGAVDKSRGLWRAALGFTATGKRKAPLGSTLPPTFAYVFGIELPLYLNILAIPNSKDIKTIEYRGLVRLTPRAEFVYDEKGLHPRFMLTLQLLGQRQLFGSALDWF